jgi:hypothetical protein
MALPVTWSVRALGRARRRLLRGRGRVCLPRLRSSPSPWVGRDGDRRLRPGLSPSPGVWRGGVHRLPGPSPSPSPGSGEAEFVVFRGRAQVRALGRARRSSSSSGAEPESEPWGRVRRSSSSFEPESWVGRGGVSYGARGRTWPLSASLCRVAQQSERRGRRCLLVRLVSGAAK